MAILKPLTEEQAKALEACGFKPGVAYVEYKPLTDLERTTIRNAAIASSYETDCLIEIIERLSGETFLESTGQLSGGTDDSGNKYELLAVEEPKQEQEQEQEELEEDTEDITISLLETRAKDLSYAFAHNPDLLSRKLKESLISIAGPEASKAYHISAYYDGKDINFNISRLSPRSIIKIETDFKTVDIGAKYYNTVNGWVVSAGLSVSAGLGFNSPDDSDIKAKFSITVSR